MIEAYWSAEAARFFLVYCHYPYVAVISGLSHIAPLHLQHAAKL